jgi:hypothetical protein
LRLRTGISSNISGADFSVDFLAASMAFPNNAREARETAWVINAGGA